MPMFETKLTGIEEAKKLLSPELFRRALKKTVFNVSHDARKDCVDEMKKLFDQPTPWILRGVTARVHDLEADIGFEEFPIGKSPADVIRPHIKGGSRGLKRSEKHLRNTYWVPGQAVRLNKYGNIRGGLITQILSSLGKFPEVGYMMNITATSRRRNKKPRNFFIVGPGNKGLHAGVWERTSSGRVKPILMFIGSPSYRPRFSFFDIVRKAIGRNIQRRFDEAVREVGVR